MNYAQRFLHSDGAGSYSLPTLAPRPMDFFQLQARFWQLHEVEHFSPVESMLYNYWLNRFNIGNGPQDRWPGSLTRKVTDVADDLGLNENTVAKARTGLEKRGLLCYRAGNKTRIAAWGLDPTAFKIDLKNSGQSAVIDLNFSGQCQDINLKNSGQSVVIDLNISGPYKEENIVYKNEEVETASSASALVEKKDTLPTESKSPVSGTEGAARRPSPHADPAQLTTADVAPLLNDPAVFKLACLDINPAYAGIDFEHYRLEMRFDSLDKELNLMPFEWRKRLRNWLTNAKGGRNGLILAAVPGQTKGDPRAIQPLAAKSSASPSKQKSWS